MKFRWTTINVKDMEVSLAFYRDIVELPLNRRFQPMPGTDIAFLGAGETEVELIQNEKNNSPQYGKDISMGFEVEDLEKTMAFLKGKGVSFQGPFQPGPMLKFIYASDPNGVNIQILQNLF